MRASATGANAVAELATERGNSGSLGTTRTSAMGSNAIAGLAIGTGGS